MRKGILVDDADSIGFDRDANIMYVINGGRDVKEPFSRLTIVVPSSGQLPSVVCARQGAAA